MTNERSARTASEAVASEHPGFARQDPPDASGWLASYEPHSLRKLFRFDSKAGAEAFAGDVRHLVRAAAQRAEIRRPERNAVLVELAGGLEGLDNEILRLAQSIDRLLEGER